MKTVLLAVIMLTSKAIFCQSVKATYTTTSKNEYGQIISISILNQSGRNFTPKSFTLDAYTVYGKSLGQSNYVIPKKQITTIKNGELVTLENFQAPCDYCVFFISIK